MSTRISVVVPHYSDLRGLSLCLDALGRQSLTPNEIVVADNNSPEGVSALERVIAGRASLTIVTEKGAGPARNGGVAVTTGDVLAFTDSDCIPSPDWLAHGLAALTHDDFVGGAMEVFAADEARLTPVEAFERVFAFDNEDYVRRKHFTVTANLFCRRELFDAVGPFLTGVSEDLEWCLRARAAGYRIGYAADALVRHPARRTWPELEGKWRRINGEAFELTKANGAGGWTWLLKALAMPLSAVAHTPRTLASPALHNLRDRVGALTILFRLRLWRMLDSLRLMSQSPQPRLRRANR